MNITIEAMDKLGGLDGINLAMIGRNTALLTTAWLSRIGVPGKDLPADSLWQVREAEVMTVDDYDTIIEKGWPAFLDGYFPRVIDPADLGDALGWLMANLSDGDQKIPCARLCDHGCNRHRHALRLPVRRALDG